MQWCSHGNTDSPVGMHEEPSSVSRPEPAGLSHHSRPESAQIYFDPEGLCTRMLEMQW